MNTITIPKNLIKEKDLIIIPREEYKILLRYRNKRILEVELTKPQIIRLKKAKSNLKKDKFLTIHELKQKLAPKS